MLRHMRHLINTSCFRWGSSLTWVTRTMLSESEGEALLVSALCVSGSLFRFVSHSHQPLWLRIRHRSMHKEKTSVSDVMRSTVICELWYQL